MTKNEVMELSLAAFECVDNWDKAEILERAAINALSTALAQPEWIGLTDDEIDAVSGSFTESEGFNQGAQWANEELKRKNS